MGRAGRPNGEGKTGFDPLRELQEEGLPDGWEAYWQGERGAINALSGVDNTFFASGYTLADNGYVLSSNEEEAEDARKKLVAKWSGTGEYRQDLFKHWAIYRHLAEKRGLVKEDYEVSLQREGREIKYRISNGAEHLPGSVDRKGSFLVGEEEKGIEKINRLINMQVTKAQDRARRAIDLQNNVAQKLLDTGIKNWDKNSPIADAVRMLGMELLDGRRLHSNKLGFEDGTDALSNPLLQILPETYQITVKKSAAGDQMIWQVRDASGTHLINGTTVLRQDAEKEAKKFIEKRSQEVLDWCKQRNADYAKNKELFQGLEAIVTVYDGQSPGRHVNLAADLPLDHLQREDLEEGYSLIVGSREFLVEEPRDPAIERMDPYGGRSKTVDSDFILVFKDGTLLPNASIGLQYPSTEYADGLLNKIMSSKRTKNLLAEGKKRADEHWLQSQGSAGI